MYRFNRFKFTVYFIAMCCFLILGCQNSSDDQSSENASTSEVEETASQEDIISGGEIEQVLYAYNGIKTYISKVGSIASFQAALIAKLADLGKQEIGEAIKNDLRRKEVAFGQKTKDAIIALAASPGFEQFTLPESHPAYGAITVGLWKKLLPEKPVPDEKERTRTLSLVFEATDYDRAEWNFKIENGKAIGHPRDPKSCLTWGPYGATFGHGDEVGAILKVVHANNPSLLPDLFGDDFDALWNTVERPSSECVDLLAPIYASKQKRNAWKAGFKTLGQMPEVRDAYEQVFWQEGYLQGKLRKLYNGIFPAGSTRKPTEVDFAFLVDIAMHAGVYKSRVKKCAEEIAGEEARTGQAVTSAKARQLVGEVFVGVIKQDTEKLPRRGRNVAYYVDGLGEEGLSAAEFDAWKYKGKRRASDFGLSDERIYIPDFLAPDLTNK